MYATIRIYNQPELADELATHADEIQGLMAGIEGLQSYVMFRTDAGCASVSVCDSEQAAEATTDAAAAWFRERTGEITEPEPIVARGEVIAAVNATTGVA
jgi:heme-degrading monooxygenase HmoA